MPVYEYRCGDCAKKSSIFFRSVSAVADPVCPHCGSLSLRRLVSMFAVHRSEESRLDDLADPSAFGDLDENDPRSVARWARRMGSEMGDELGPEFHEMVDRLEAGEDPESVMGDDAMGGLGGMDTMGGLGGMDLGGDSGDD